MSEPGEAEVEDFELAIASQEEVLGLEVAMHHAGRVGGRQPLAELHRVLHRPPRGQGLALEALAERFPLEQLERQEGHPMVGADVVDGEDVGVIERGDRARLLLEPADTLGVGDLGGKNLQCDVASEARITRPVDLPHPPCPEGRDDLVGAQTVAGSEGHR